MALLEGVSLGVGFEIFKSPHPAQSLSCNCGSGRSTPILPQCYACCHATAMVEQTSEAVSKLSMNCFVSIPLVMVSLHRNRTMTKTPGMNEGK